MPRFKGSPPPLDPALLPEWLSREFAEVEVSQIDGDWISLGAADMFGTWTNTGGEYPGFRYRRDRTNNVYFNGRIEGAAVTGGNSSAPVFTLPLGYRPIYRHSFPVLMGPDPGTLARLDIHTDGIVSVLGYDASAWVSMDSVVFWAEQ